MRFIPDGRLRRLVLITCLGVLAAMAIAGATSARVDVGSSGTASAFAGLTNDGGGQVTFGGQDQTICHANASADGGNQHNGYNIETVSVDNIVKDSGHGSHTDIGGKSDIIPAFDYTKTVKGTGHDPDVTTTEHFPGLGTGSVCRDSPATADSGDGQRVVHRPDVRNRGWLRPQSTPASCTCSRGHGRVLDNTVTVTATATAGYVVSRTVGVHTHVHGGATGL